MLLLFIDKVNNNISNLKRIIFMIRSTKATLKYANQGKKEDIHRIIAEYRRVVSLFIDLLWDQEKIPTFLPKEITSKIETWLPARMVQCAGKQASGIVRGTKKKQLKRKCQIKKFIEQGMFKKARILQAKYDLVIQSKPIINEIEMELDSRFITIDLDKKNSFDGWIIFGPGNKTWIKIPFNRTRHFNKLFKKGLIKAGIRLSKSTITFMFEITPNSNSSSCIAGIDIGIKSLISIDYGDKQSQSDKDNHGWDFDKINERLCRRKKGSSNYKKTQSHRKNYINNQLNKLDWMNVGFIRIEKIKHLRKGVRTSRRLSHFVYRQIFGRIEQKAEEFGVQVAEISPTYTSQRCSHCGWTRKSNRKGKLFKCKSCGFTADADLNASKNIRLLLPIIDRKERLLQKNRTGFYWNVASKEPIVPSVLKT